MANQRFFLYLALAFILYMIWLTWQHEQAPLRPVPPPSATQGEVRGLPEAEDLPELLAPDTPEVPATAAAPEREPPRASARTPKVQVRTDVLDVVIDTRGGDIRQLDTLTYPVSLQEKDV